MNKQVKGLLEILGVVILFVLFSFFIQHNLEFFERYVTNDFLGMIVYFFLEVISIVIAPITTFPLIIVASNLWGWFLAGTLSLFSWTVGSWIAFAISRKYGVRIIKKFISLENLHKIENKIPTEHLFLSVVLLRIIIPMDVLSYALGLFSKMKTKDFVLATIIGSSPMAFDFAYLGNVPIYFQIVLLLIVGIIILVIWILKIILRKCFFWEEECKLSKGND